MIIIKYGEPNPLAVFDLRQVSFCPPHFQQITFDLYAAERTLLDWIHENTEGRFFFGQMVTSEGLAKTCIGFELAAETTLFAMYLPQLNKPEVF